MLTNIPWPRPEVSVGEDRERLRILKRNLVHWRPKYSLPCWSGWRAVTQKNIPCLQGAHHKATFCKLGMLYYTSQPVNVGDDRLFRTVVCLGLLIYRWDNWKTENYNHEPNNHKVVQLIRLGAREGYFVPQHKPISCSQFCNQVKLLTYCFRLLCHYTCLHSTSLATLGISLGKFLTLLGFLLLISQARELD